MIFPQGLNSSLRVHVVCLSPVFEAVGVTNIPTMLVTSSALITGLKFLQGPRLLGLLIMPMFVLVSDDQVLNLMQLSQDMQQSRGSCA